MARSGALGLHRAVLRRTVVPMFRMRRAPTLLVLCSWLSGQQATGQGPDNLPAPASPAAAAADEFAARLQRIRPAADELAFLAVPWRTELRTALVDGDAQDKPVLLWAMNGHPLGQT